MAAVNTMRSVRGDLAAAVEEFRDALAVAVAPQHLRDLIADAVEFETQLLRLRVVLGLDTPALRTSMGWVFGTGAVTLAQLAAAMRDEVEFVCRLGPRQFEPILGGDR